MIKKITVKNDSLIDMLSHQYVEEIHEVLLESEHLYKSELDLNALNTKLSEVYRSAITDGLPEDIILELIEHALPHCYSKLTFMKKVAA